VNWGGDSPISTQSAEVKSYPLIPPQNVRITNPGEANQAVAWNAVGGAKGYMVYAFEDAAETDVTKAVGSQLRAANQTSITIGSGEYLDDQTLQQFDMPLPAGDYYFRVMTIAEDEANNTALSAATEASAKPGRRISTAQVTALINDENAIWNTSGKGFIMIDVRNSSSGNVMGNLQIPQNNTSPNSASGPIFEDSDTAINFFNRVLHEIKAHPAYNGPDTLIFIH